MTQRKKFFAASNTERGFVSFFPENFRCGRTDRCYIIKGGPGTGKSRLLLELAEAAEKVQGEVEYYYCSSDPLSLDGIFITLGERKISVIDGTPPHSEDISLAGVRDNIIDLGSFWNRSRLWEAREDIARLGAKKQRAYTEGYRALAAAGALLRASSELMLECTDLAAMRTDARDIAAHLPQTAPLRSPLSAIGMRGRVAFDTFREMAELVVEVVDSRSYGISFAYFDALISALDGRCRISPTAIFPDRADGVLAGGVGMVSAPVPTKTDSAIDVSMYVDRSAYLLLKERIDVLRRLGENAILSAEAAFSEAGEAHAEIEKIYSGAMDFDKKEEYSARLCREIWSGDL